jgi:hypothetical protein
MDRRKSLKALFVGTVSTSVLIDACKNDADKKTTVQTTSANKDESLNTDERKPEEQELYKKVIAENFFTAHELATITILGDIIIPKDEVSGSASDAKVTDFIEFIVKDMPEHQTPMRGGLRWLDMQCLTRNNNSFKDCTQQQQMEMIDEIAWPNKAKPNMLQGVAFFNLMRDLTASGFYTSEIGVKDIGYMGNRPNQWNGVPADVQKQYNIFYSDKELKECVSYDNKV